MSRVLERASSLWSSWLAIVKCLSYEPAGQGSSGIQHFCPMHLGSLCPITGSSVEEGILNLPASIAGKLASAFGGGIVEKCWMLVPPRKIP